MKSWISSVGFTFAVLSLASVAYLFSDHYEERRLSKQISSEFKVRLTHVAKLYESKNYGGLEEGGEVAILKLHKTDCELVSSAMKKSDNRSKDKIFPMSDVGKFLQELEMQITKPITTYRIDDKGNSFFYAIDKRECLLVRDAYFE